MDKKSLSERDICTKYITPALELSGWDKMEQVREEVTFTAGKVIVRGKLVTRGKKKRADYILYYKPNIPIAIIEAKKNSLPLGSGMQQVINYGEILDLPFVFSSNGDGFIEHDRLINDGKKETELSLNDFPSPQQLWDRYCLAKGIDNSNNHIVTQDYYFDPSGKTPRYYQNNAVNRTIEAIARGQKRLLLVMATGTGKTFTAFQIIWRLWKSRTKKRILFLADRNILVDQTRVNDFKPFGSAMTKITNRKVDKSYEIFLTLYQAITGPEEKQKIYKDFSKDFFDLIIIDECHRGSAAEDSAWREILEYFSEATQIGLTATPKETEYVSSTFYFGDPIYTYSLKQGIEDGFLAPYKVIRIDLDRDLQGWRPEKGKKDKSGNEIEDRIYNQKDFDRSLVLEKRTEVIAKKITELLKATNRYDKTIVFCEDIDHAERMRSCLVNQNPDEFQKNSRYVMRITGDNQEGKNELDNFIFPESKYPVIATTSKLLTTGVDAQTCKIIVLDRIINSMTEFKQIIGRGTRINEEFGKLFFTIVDFKKATELFSDPDFDGEPVQIYEPGPEDLILPEENDEDESTELIEDGSELINDIPEGSSDEILWPSENEDRRVKYYVNDVQVNVIAERVQYYGEDGKLITESLKDYTRKTVKKEFASLDTFLKKWNSSDMKKAVIEELENTGILFAPLAETVGRDYEPFDLICHVVYDQPPLTRKERAENVRKRNYFTKYGEKAREVLSALLDKYSDTGIENIEDMNVLKLQPINQLGTPIEIIKSFGGKENFQKAIRELENIIYEVA